MVIIFEEDFKITYSDKDTALERGNTGIMIMMALFFSYSSTLYATI